MIARALLLLTACSVCLAIVYYRAPMNYFRAESGWILIIAHADEQAQQWMKNEFVRYSRLGHYNPVGFLGEFYFSKVAATNGNIWRARQLIFLLFVTAALFVLVRTVAEILGVSGKANTAMAAALTATVVFQQGMAEFVGWPIVVLQIIWMGCAVLTLYALVRFALVPTETRWLWIAGLASYGAVHFFGLGFVLVAATAITVSGVVFIELRRGSGVVRQQLGRIAAPVLTMLCVAGLHGWAIYFLRPPAEGAPFKLPFYLDLKLVLGFAWQYALSGVQAFLPGASKGASAGTLSYSWPYGLLLLAGVLFAGAMLLRRACTQQRREATTHFVLYAFSSAVFLMLVALIVLREVAERTSIAEAAHWLAGYTWIPRYVIPAQLAFLGGAMVLAASVARRLGPTAAPLFCAVAFGALVTQIDFQQNAFRHLAPRSRISHDTVWRHIVEAVQECRAAGLPVPDMRLDVLTQELPGVYMRSLVPLLRRELGLNESETIAFVPWETYRAGDREPYRRLRSLRKVQRDLELRRKDGQ